MTDTAIEPQQDLHINRVVPAQGSFMDMIERLSLQPDINVEKIKQIMDMQEHILDRNAKQAFNAAMVKAQAEMPIVPKDKNNDQTRSKYSAYETVLRYAKPVYTKYGFSIMFYEGETAKEGNIRVCADVMHEDGHTEKRFTDVPIDDKGIKGTTNKTQTHAKGSSLSYGKGYLIKMIFNIPTGDDDDGNAAGGRIHELASSGDIAEISEKYKKGRGDEKKFSQWLMSLHGVSTPAELTRAQALSVIRTLDARIKELAK